MSKPTKRQPRTPTTSVTSASPTTPATSVLRRSFKEYAGYDCRVVCTHKEKGDHGIGAIKWLYAVADDECALRLTVNSGRYPPSVVDLSRAPEGSDLSLHVPWPENLEAAREGTAACTVLAAGQCYCGFSTVLGAREFFATYGQSTSEQNEIFWLELEKVFVERVAYSRENRDALAERICPHCHGKGLKVADGH